MQLDEAQASAIAQALEFATFTVASMETKPYRRRPVPPFTTSTLQQTAGNRLGMSSRQTMACGARIVRKRLYHLHAYRFGDAVARGDRSRTRSGRQAFRRNYLSDAPETICHKDGRRAGSPRMHQAGGREIPVTRGNRKQSAGRPAQTVHADRQRTLAARWQTQPVPRRPCDCPRRPNRMGKPCSRLPALSSNSPAL